MAQSQPTLTSYLTKLDSELEKIFVGKVPALPENVKETLGQNRSVPRPHLHAPARSPDPGGLRSQRCLSTF